MLSTSFTTLALLLGASAPAALAGRVSFTGVHNADLSTHFPSLIARLPTPPSRIHRRDNVGVANLSDQKDASYLVNVCVRAASETCIRGSDSSLSTGRSTVRSSRSPSTLALGETSLVLSSEIRWTKHGLTATCGLRPRWTTRRAPARTATSRTPSAQRQGPSRPRTSSLRGTRSKTRCSCPRRTTTPARTLVFSGSGRTRARCGSTSWATRRARTRRSRASSSRTRRRRCISRRCEWLCAL
jgi:hypothetical protein